LIDLGLRLHQRLVTQLEVGGDQPRADRVGRDEIDIGAVRQAQIERTDAVRDRIGVVQRRGGQRARRRKLELGCKAGADELEAPD